jgi:two-component system, NarL family, invasion response regulator UvrY
METKILIADDHSIVKMGLTAILNKMRIQNIDTANTIEELKAQISTTNYTHLILDIIMPDGNSLELIESINTKYPSLSILVHSMQPVEVYGKIANKYNIHSYLHKGASESEIFYQLELFVKNQPLNIKKKLDDSVNPFSTLAVRELEILHYLLNGHRTKEIATSLGLKMNTVSTIKSNIFEKVKAESFTHLLQLAHVHQISY